MLVLLFANLLLWQQLISMMPDQFGGMMTFLLKFCVLLSISEVKYDCLARILVCSNSPGFPKQDVHGFFQRILFSLFLFRNIYRTQHFIPRCLALPQEWNVYHQNSNTYTCKLFSPNSPWIAIQNGCSCRHSYLNQIFTKVRFEGEKIQKLSDSRASNRLDQFQNERCRSVRKKESRLVIS